MITLDRPVVVEGKYDVIKLSSVIDAPIFRTDGFGIFRDKELRQTLRTLARKRGVIVMTDSDAAGFRIRRAINELAAGCDVTNVYIPDVFGTEKRKKKPSAEGKLGVEGMSEEIILSALERAGVTRSERPRGGLTTARLFADGLTGRESSAAKRRALLAELGLPSRLSVKQLIDVVELSLGIDEYERALERINGDDAK